jgi:hypothetical protein
MKSLATWTYAAASALLISGPVLAQQPPAPKPTANEIKAQCIAEGKNAGLSAALLDDYVKQCMNRNSGGNVNDQDGKR